MYTNKATIRMIRNKDNVNYLSIIQKFYLKKFCDAAASIENF